MRALVTGGAGFIGSNLVDRLLQEGHEVGVVDNLATGKLANLEEAQRNSKFVFLEGDITEANCADTIAQFRPDVVFHLAAQADVRVSVANPVFDAEVNVIGTLRVIEGAVKGGAKKIIAAASGGTLYGEAPPELLPIPETAPWQPLSPYGISKKVMVDYLRSAQAMTGIETTALALGNVFGPRQDPHGEAGVIAIFFQHYEAGTVPTVFGTGEQTRDFIFVEDVVSAFLAASQKDGSGELINIGTGVETSVNQLVDAMNQITQRVVSPVKAPARPGELDRSVLNIRKAHQLLRWEPSTSVLLGLEKTWRWFQESRNAQAL